MKIKFIAIALAAAAVAQPALAQMDLEVALGDVSLQKVPFLIAADAGIYEKNGLKVHQYITPSAARAAAENGVTVPPENIGDKETSQASVSIGGGAWLIAAVASGKLGSDHPIILATNENIVRDHIISRPDIRTESDLKGKSLGSSFRDVTGYDGVVYLERIGMSNDVTIVAPASLSAVKDGRADAVMANLFMSARATDEGLRDLVDVGKYRIPEAGSGVMVDPAWLKANGDTAQRFLRSMVEATALMKRDKVIFAQTLKRWFNVTDTRMVDRLFVMAQGFPDKPYPAVDGITKAMKVYDSDVLRSMTPQSFYDDAPLRAALSKPSPAAR